MDIQIGSVNKRAVWTIALLIGGYIMLQLVTDVTVAKMVTIAGVSVPAGSLLYAVTFTWRDAVHKRLGAEWARAAIVLAGFFNVFMALWFVLTIRLPAASFWGLQDAYSSVLGIMPRVVAASITVEVVAQLLDTYLYQRVEHRYTGRRQYMRVVVSNTISAPLDGLLFGVLAFAGTMPLSGLLSIVWGGMLFKLLIGYAVIPLIYMVRDEKIKLVSSLRPA